MTTIEFTQTFLPHLVELYVDGKLPLHGLVDIELWKRIYPEQLDSNLQKLHWDQIGFTCHKENNGILLITFMLPKPTCPGEALYLSIRLRPQARDTRRAVIYTLRQPANRQDAWDIYYLPLPNKQGKLEQKYRVKLEGEVSLRNYVKAVQQIAFDDDQYDDTIFGRLRKLLLNAITPQSDEEDYPVNVAMVPST